MVIVIVLVEAHLAEDMNDHQASVALRGVSVGHDLNSAQIEVSARVVEESAPTEGRVRLSEESVHRVVAVLRTVLSGSHALNHQIVHQAASNVEIDHSQVQENFLKNVRDIINKYDLW